MHTQPRRMTLIAAAALVAVGCTAQTSLTPRPSVPASEAGASSSSAAGSEYTSDGFEPAFTATLPEGWTHDGTSFAAPSGGGDRYMEVLRDWNVASASCDEVTEAGVGDTAADIARALAARDGLQATEPEAVTVGGLSGQQLDFAMSADWTGDCPWSDGTPVVPTLGTDANGDWLFLAAGTGERFRYIVLDADGGGTVLLNIVAAGDVDFEAHVAEAMTIVETIDFR